MRIAQTILAEYLYQKFTPKRKMSRPRHDAGKMKQVVVDFQKSQVSLKDYCAEQGISLAAFAYWKKKLLAGALDFEPGLRLIDQKPLLR